jgi:hypothetical protein
MVALLCASLPVLPGCAREPATGTPQPTVHGDGIRPSIDNPRYWQFRGRPTLLLGGTDTDAIFQWDADRLASHLDVLVAAGGNYIRNVMSARDPVGRGDVQPFRRLDDGRYDLDEWNQEYWIRFDRMLAETARRDIVVQIELWDGHDFQSRLDNEDGFPQWDAHPLNPKNNVNYTAEETTVPEKWTRGYPNEAHPALLTAPGLNHDRIVLPYQERFIRAVLERSLAYDHVLYVIQNETWIDRAWSNYWAGFARESAAARGRRIYVGDMRFQPSVMAVIEDGFDFADLSQSASGAERPPDVHIGQGHFDFIAGQLAMLDDAPAPVNSVKQYGGDAVDWTMGADEGVERVWRTIFAGQAAVRFHRPESGIGLSGRARANIRSLRMVADTIDIFHVQPHQRVGKLLGDRLENEAYLMADPGRVYAVFFTAGGGEVSLDVSGLEGKAVVRWLNPNTAEWGRARTVAGGTVTLAAPDEGQWVAIVSRAPET